MEYALQLDAKRKTLVFNEIDLDDIAPRRLVLLMPSERTSRRAPRADLRATILCLTGVYFLNGLNVSISCAGSRRRSLATASADSTVQLWRWEDGSHVHTFEGHQAGINDVAWSADAQFLASASDDMTIRLWDVTEQKAVNTFAGHTNYVMCLNFNHKGNMLVGAPDAVQRCLLASLLSRCGRQAATHVRLPPLMFCKGRVRSQATIDRRVRHQQTLASHRPASSDSE